MNCQPLSEVGDGSLCAGVCRNLCKRCKSVHGAYVDDVAAFAADHVLGKSLCRKQSSDKVQVEHEFQIFVLKVEESLGISVHVAQFKIFLVSVCSCIVAACTVNEDVALAVLCKDFLMCSFNACLVCYINLHSNCISAHCLDFFSNCFCLGNSTVKNRNASAAKSQSLCKLTAKHACTAGDNSNFSV